MDSLKKRDGRKNNGGARPGAGRPRHKIVQVYDEDRLFADRILKSKTVYSVRRNNRQARRVKRTRFEILLDFFVQSGILRKGRRRDFKEFVEIALDTPLQEVYDHRKDRLEYEINQVKKEEERINEIKIAKDAERAKTPEQLEFDKRQQEDIERREIIKRQTETNKLAVEKHIRNKQRDR